MPTPNNAHSFPNLLQTFGFEDEQAYTAWLKTQPDLPHDVSLIQARLDSALSKDPSITADQKKDIQDIFSASMTHDAVTGGLGKEWNELFFKTAQLHTQHHALNPTHIVELDFSNMSGANNAIGREPVNRSVAIMANIYDNALKKAGGSLTSIRTGGDELRFYVTGIGQEQIQTAINEAQDTTAQFTHELGTDRLEHTKYKGDPIRSGFGVGAASITLSTQQKQSPEEIQKSLDDGIDAHKQKIGTKRQLSASQLISADELRKYASRDHVESVIKAWENKLHIGKSTPHTTPELLKLSSFTEDSYASRINKVELHAEGWPESAKKLLLAGAKLYNAYDPTTGLKAPKALFDDLEYHQDQASQNSDQYPTITLLEITNLRGLNKHFNHEDANQIIHDEVNHFANSLTQALPNEPNLKDHLYSLGASRFCLITTQTPADELQNKLGVTEHYQERLLPIRARLGSEQAASVFQTPNPTKHVMGLNGESTPETGLMITHTTIPISANKDITPKAQIQILEDLSDIYGFRPEAIKTHNELNTFEKGKISLKMDSDTPWWVGNSKTQPVQGIGIPEDIAKHALAGIRVPRESLPRIIAETTPLRETPDVQIIVPESYRSRLQPERQLTRQ